MQTAADRNGSSSTTTISTTHTTTKAENDNNTNGTMTQYHHQHPKQSQQNHQHHYQPHSLIQAIPETETTNNLRHRVSKSTNNGTHCSATTGTKNSLSHLIDAAEYVGSQVEYLSVTPPSTSQQSVPSKSNQLEEDFEKLAVAGRQTIAIATPSQDKCRTSTPPESFSLKTASNSASTTSTVIATQAFKHNGTVIKHNDWANLKQVMSDKSSTRGIGESEEMALQTNKMGYESVVKTEGAAKDCQTIEYRKEQLATNQHTQVLPYENPSTTRIIQRESPSHSLPMSLPTVSLSITAPPAAADENKHLASSTSATPSPSPPSSLISSSSASITSVTSTTTPALLTTPPLSSSPSSSSSISPSSSLSSLSHSAHAKMKGVSISGLVEAELLQWHDMPQYLQFNPYVLRGYRPLASFKGCLLSLFYWHNETINILTHAIPIVYILAIVPGLMPWESGYRFLSFCHVFGAVAPWCGSFLYHLFMNIEQGENVYRTLLKLDMLGIWVSQSFGALPLLTASTYCFNFKWKWLIIISYSLLSIWGLYKALTASSPWQRRLCFALPFAMRSILTFFRTFGLVGGNRVAMEHVFLQDGVSILGGAIGAMRIPEKWFPGLVDFYLNSHNIMHVLVVVAVYSMYKATMKDFEWMETANCDAFVNVTSKVLESTLNTKIEL